MTSLYLCYHCAAPHSNYSSNPPPPRPSARTHTTHTPQAWVTVRTPSLQLGWTCSFLGCFALFSLQQGASSFSSRSNSPISSQAMEGGTINSPPPVNLALGMAIAISYHRRSTTTATTVEVWIWVLPDPRRIKTGIRTALGEGPRT